MMQFAETESFIQLATDFFDQLVPVATDDELFAAGYLRGHVDLIVGTLQLTEEPFTVQTLVEQVEASLAKAIANDELSAQDEQQVRAVWQQLVANSRKQ